MNLDPNKWHGTELFAKLPSKINDMISCDDGLLVACEDGVYWVDKDGDYCKIEIEGVDVNVFDKEGLQIVESIIKAKQEPLYSARIEL